MKKKSRTIIVILVMVVMAILTGCEKKPGKENNDEKNGEDKITLSGTIIHKTDNSLLILENSEDENACGLYDVGIEKVSVTDSHNAAISKETLTEGMNVLISYDGQVQETYPGQVSGASNIEVTEQTGDLIGMYLRVINSLYEEDPGLNSEIHTIVLDLTQITNLTEGQKAALQYLMACNYESKIRRGTLKELEEEGLVKDLYFEDGILFVLSDHNSKDGSFSFKAKKWRSGLGAIGYDNCKASIEDGLWEYELSGGWIS